MLDIKKWRDRVDSFMIALTFAEAGQREMALDVLHQEPKKKRPVARVKKQTEQRPVLRV